MSGIVAIFAGASHNLAVRNDGTVWAWGYNSNGQLGNNCITDSHVPVQVSGLTGVVAVAGGYSHSMALRNDGTVWSWGYNAYGQLGNNTTVDAHVAVQVSGLTGVGSIGAGFYHSLAVRSDGTAWSWDYNAYGALGDNTVTQRNTPVQVSGLTNVASVSGGSYHSAALKHDGTVWTWGYNAYGQLGNGTTTDSHVPVGVGLSDMTAVSAGNAEALTLRVSGGVAAWGYNGYGGLGDGTVVDRHSPVDVASYNRGSGTLYSRGSAPRATYAYDGTGLRSSKTVAGVSKAFVYDFSQGLPLVLSDGDRNYIYGADGQPLEQIDAAGNVSFFHHDQLGSTRALTDSTGAITGTFTYDPYGNLTGRSGTAVTPLGYAGEYTDAQTGFIYLRARYYDPATGQFISRDPITDLTGAPYSYADNNPLNATDPTGMLCVTLWHSNCESLAHQFKREHPKAAQQITNFAGGPYSSTTYAEPLDTSGVFI